jgi:hypothetical protein
VAGFEVIGDKNRKQANLSPAFRVFRVFRGLSPVQEVQQPEISRLCLISNFSFESGVLLVVTSASSLPPLPPVKKEFEHKTTEETEKCKV